MKENNHFFFLPLVLILFRGFFFLVEKMAQSFVSILHRHALESIFGFLSLEELASTLAVSRSWASAVGTMKRLESTINNSLASRALVGLCEKPTGVPCRIDFVGAGNLDVCRLDPPRHVFK